MDRTIITILLQQLVRRSGNDLLYEGTLDVVPVTQNIFDLDYLPYNSGKHQYFQVHITEKKHA